MQPLEQQRVALVAATGVVSSVQIGAVEAGDDGALVRDVERRRRCPRPPSGVAVAVSARTRSRADVARGLGQLQVVGPEVVAPLGDAVRFVDGEQRDRARSQLREEALVVEALGRDVQQLRARRRAAGR